MTIAWEAAGASDTGRRRRGNEDALRLDSSRGVFLVADGMGGHAAGEVASALAADAVARALVGAVDAGASGDDLLRVLPEAFRAAHQAICDCCSDDRRTRGMGTTLTACVVGTDGTLRAGHIGDSRLYRLRGPLLEQLSHDHTWVQREVDAGRLTPQAARQHQLSHVVSRVLSEDMRPDPDVLSADVAPGDLLLLATDGLYNMLEDAEIASLLRADAPLSARAGALIDAANRAGGADNITVVLIRILPG